MVGAIVRPIAPSIGKTEVTIAENQLEYRPLVGTLGMGPLGIELITRWTFTPAEREAIAGGQDLYIRQLIRSQPMQPLDPTIGWP